MDICPPLFAALGIPYDHECDQGDLCHKHMILKLWELEAANDLERLNQVVAKGVEHVQQQLANLERNPPSGNCLMIKNHRTIIVEMYVHALYSNQLEAIKADGQFRTLFVHKLFEV